MGSVSSTTSETSSPIMAGKADPYADIDFEEINEQTNLANDEIKCLKVCFDLFDTKKQEFLSGDDLGDIMRAMGFRPSEEELAELLHEVDEDASGVYDKEGQGFITTETLRGLIGELLAPLTDEELEGIIEELDEDGSGSMDFDEFCEMMMIKPESGDD